MADEFHAMRDRLLAGLEAARRAGADAAKIDYHEGETVACAFEAGRLKSGETRTTAAYAIEVLAGGRKGNASGTDPADVEDLVGRAVTLAQAGAVAHFAAYPAPAPTAEVRTFSERTAALDREALVEACGRTVEPLKARDAGLHIEAGGRRSRGRSLLVTTGGVCHASEYTAWSLSTHAQRTEGTDMLFAGEGRGWGDVDDRFDPDAIAAEVLRDLERGERTAPPPVGRVRAVLSPAIFGRFLGAIFLGTNGRNVAKGDSPLRGRLGERVLDPCLSITDDPHLAFAPGAAEIDDDGVPTRPTTLVEAGVLRAFLYDLDSAGLAGAEPTGHAGCSPYVPEVAPGEEPHEALLGSLDDGLYVKGLIGFGQSNLANGDFSANVALGFRVQDGEIVGRVKNTMIAGNVYELLGEGVRLSADLDPVRRVPWCAIENLSASAGAG
jgi:PmbA protein